MFPTHQQQQARLTLASVLRGVISQRLLPRADGKGMVPALEIMVNTERVREMIEDPNRTREIKSAIVEGLHPYGMVSFDQSLSNLVKQKLVTYEEAVKHLREALPPGELRSQMARPTADLVTLRALFFLAMAQHRAGDKRAGETLKEAERGAEQLSGPELADPYATWAKLELELLRKEAQGVLKS